MGNPDMSIILFNAGWLNACFIAFHDFSPSSPFFVYIA